jgi:hypothetical protein
MTPDCRPPAIQRYLGMVATLRRLDLPTAQPGKAVQAAHEIGRFQAQQTRAYMPDAQSNLFRRSSSHFAKVLQRALRVW